MCNRKISRTYHELNIRFKIYNIQLFEGIAGNSPGLPSDRAVIPWPKSRHSLSGKRPCLAAIRRRRFTATVNSDFYQAALKNRDNVY
jgi:hypothetical protein